MIIRFVMAGLLVLAACKSTSDKRAGNKVAPPSTTEGGADEPFFAEPAEDPGQELIVTVENTREGIEVIKRIAEDPQTPPEEKKKAEQAAELLTNLADQMENVAKHGTPAQKKRMCEAALAGGAIVGGDQALEERSTFATVGWVVAGLALAGGTYVGGALYFPMSKKKMEAAITAAYGAGWRDLSSTVQGARKYGAIEYKAYLDAVDGFAATLVGKDAPEEVKKLVAEDYKSIVRPDGGRTNIKNVAEIPALNGGAADIIVSEAGESIAEAIPTSEIFRVASEAKTGDPVKLRTALIEDILETNRKQFKELLDAEELKVVWQDLATKAGTESQTPTIKSVKTAFLNDERVIGNLQQSTMKDALAAKIFPVEEFEQTKFEKLRLQQSDQAAGEISRIQSGIADNIKNSDDEVLKNLKKVQAYVGTASWAKFKARAPSRNALIATGVAVSAVAVGYGIYKWSGSDDDASSLSLTDAEDGVDKTFADAAQRIDAATLECAAS